MSIEERLGDLFDDLQASDEQATPLSEESADLEKFIFGDNNPSEQSADSKFQQKDDKQEDAPPPLDSQGVEKREFSRAYVADKQIKLNFQNEFQFARQYIDNISMGGLFVRTREKKPLGTLVPIQFELPSTQDQDHSEQSTAQQKSLSFNLTAKVCRVTDDGVGLEFTNLDDDTKKTLENYVRQSLPKGVDVKARAKQITIDRLAERRKKRQEQKKARQRSILGVIALIVLFTINGLLVRENLKEPEIRAIQKDDRVTLQGNQIKMEEIQAIYSDENGELRLSTVNGETYPLDINSNELPLPLRHSVQLIRSVPPKTPERRSQNASSTTRPGY